MKYGIWVDTGCDDFERAAENRKMIANKENITWWLWMEVVRDSWPYREELPWYIPQAELPVISKTERPYINDYGIYEIGDDGQLIIDAERNKEVDNED